jgi:sulfonate transport system substrate-binding protein
MKKVLLLPAVALVAACSSTSSTSADPPATTPLAGVTLRVGDQVNITESGLEAAGEAATPYKIEWSSFPSGPPMLEALNADAIDIGGVGDAPPIFAAAGGADIKIVQASETAEANQGILVRPGSTITSVADLRGKTVAVAKGSSANWILLKALQANHLTPSDVHIAYLQPTDAQPAFNSGTVDAWVVWDPFASVAEAQGAKMILTGQDLGIPGLAFEVASDSALRNPTKTAAITDFLGRLRAAEAWEQANKPAWAQKYAALTKLPLALTEKVLQFDTNPAALDTAVVGAEQAEADAFYAAALIPTKVAIPLLLDTTFPTTSN